MKNRSGHQHYSSPQFTHRAVMILLTVCFCILWSNRSSALEQYSDQLSADGADVLIPGGGNTKIPDDVPANTEISGYCSYCKQDPLTANSTPGSNSSGNNGQGQGL